MVTQNSNNEPTAASGKVLQAQGVGVASAFSTATYPATAGTNGKILISDGTNFNSTTFTPISTITGDSGSITDSSSNLNAKLAGLGDCGVSVTFSETIAGEMDLVVTDASFNTIIGRYAGASATTAASNTGCGYGVMNILDSGNNNVSFGNGAMQAGTITGSDNVSFGVSSNYSIGSGSYNIGLGFSGGTNLTDADSHNINVNSSGSSSESNVLQFGIGTGTSDQFLNSAFICGITGIVVTGTPVLVSSGDQLGIAVSSKRFKNDTQDMPDITDKLMALRPVTFVWDKSSVPGLRDAEDQRQFGLIAEEVDQAFPYLCSYDKDGKPFSVKYNELNSMLLQELKKMVKRTEALETV